MDIPLAHSLALTSFSWTSVTAALLSARASRSLTLVTAPRQPAFKLSIVEWTYRR